MHALDPVQLDVARGRGSADPRLRSQRVEPLDGVGHPRDHLVRTQHAHVEVGHEAQRASSLTRPVVEHDRAGCGDAEHRAGDDAVELVEFGGDLALYLALLWLILSGAAWAQVELGLRPLARVRNELDALKANPAGRLRADYPSEIRPLTNAINGLAEARENDLAAARRRAADLAHGLKTPLAALAAGSRRAREAGAADAADGLDRAIATATAAVNAELARSRAATIRHIAGHQRTAAQPIVEGVIGVVERTDFGAERVFEVEVPENLLAERQTRGRRIVARSAPKESLPATAIERANETRVVEYGAEGWFALAAWAKDTDNFQPWQRGLAFSIGKFISSGRTPTAKMVRHGVKMLEEADRLGFAPEQIPR